MASVGTLMPLLVVAAVTPGPNNLVMLRIGVERGMWAVPRPATGVVLGGLAMLLVSRAGVALAFAAHPWLPTLIRVAGAGSLAWLGVRLIRATDGKASEQSLPASAPGLLGMVLFQFVNPKAWLLVLTVVAAGSDARSTSLVALIVLFVLIPYACLALWAAGGSLAARLLREPRARAWLDRSSGALLALSALLLLRP